MNGIESIDRGLGGPRLSTLAVHSGSVFAGAVERRDGPRAADPALRLTRSQLPAAARLEERLAALEGGSAAVSFSTGVGCLAALLAALLREGDEAIVADADADSRLVRVGRDTAAGRWTLRSTDPDQPEAVARLVSPRTQAILVSSIADEDGAVADVTALGEIARRAQVPLIVDNTAATPALARPLAAGADAVLHLSAERLGGSSQFGALIDGGTFDWGRSGRYVLIGEGVAELGGASLTDLAANFELAAAVRLMAERGYGAPLSKSAAAAVASGLETLPLRMRRASESALAVAKYLAGRPEVANLAYRGLLGDRYHALGLRYSPEGGGAVMTFGLRGGADAAERFLGSLRLFGGGGNVSHARLSRRPGEAARGAIRLAVGLEDPADLIADIAAALGEG
ncbi:MAG: PLP-dependent transferase [Bauldia sp.]